MSTFLISTLPTDLQQDTRVIQLCQWLSQENRYDLDFETFSIASADASFRRYFRIWDVQGKSYIAMDAPPQHYSLMPFITVCKLFGQSGMSVPTIYLDHHDDGFMLIEDLGTTTYADALSSETADDLYTKASNSLILLQQASKPNILPIYDHAVLMREMRLFDEWYVTQHKQIILSDAEKAMLEQQYSLIAQYNLSQPQGYVHRDFHCRNLMVCGDKTPGVIDFQDALYGPITYDIASLWRDAYVHWDEERQIDWVIRFWEKARAAKLPVRTDFGEFYRDFEWMGLQRHLKVLGIFSRLSIRDNKHGYLNDLPLVESYVFQVIHRYSELTPLAHFFDKHQWVSTTTHFTF